MCENETDGLCVPCCELTGTLLDILNDLITLTYCMYASERYIVCRL